MKNVNFNTYSDNYNEILKEQLDFFEKDNEYFALAKIKLVSNHIRKSPKKILEYGCGIGRNLKYLKDYFPDSQLFGCDISDKSLEIAQKNNTDVTFHLLGQDQIDQKFDLIFIANVFHHIPVDQRNNALQEVSNLLDPDGEVFIFEHNPFNPLTRHLVNTCPFDKDAKLITPKDLSALLSKNNFSVSNFGYYLFVPSFLKQLRFIEHYLKWLPLGGQYFVNFRQDLVI